MRAIARLFQSPALAASYALAARRITLLFAATAMILVGITVSTPLPASAESRPIVITGRSGDRTFQLDVNLPGMDYRSEQLSANNPQLCQQLCNNADMCRAWTFVKAGVQGRQAVCWLKNSVPRAFRDTNTISGVKLEAKQPVAFGYDMPGNDYRSVAMSAWSECQRICDQETPCKAWSWVGAGVHGHRPMCMLKNDVPARMANAKAASGVKAGSAPPAEQAGSGSGQTSADPFGSRSSDEASMQGSASPATQPEPSQAASSAAQQAGSAQSGATSSQQAGEAASSSMQQQGAGQSGVPSSAQQAGETAASSMQQQGSGQSGVSSSGEPTANEAAASSMQPVDGTAPELRRHGLAERRAAKVAAARRGLQTGIDMPGKDYRNAALNEGANAPAACESLCAQEAQCKAWTWVKAGIQGPKVMCWLKNEVPPSVPNPNTVSGLRVQ